MRGEFVRHRRDGRAPQVEQRPDAVGQGRVLVHLRLGHADLDGHADRLSGEQPLVEREVGGDNALDGEALLSHTATGLPVEPVEPGGIGDPG